VRLRVSAKEKRARTGGSLPEYFRLVGSLFDLVVREADRRIDSAGVGMICCSAVAINVGLLMCHRLVREAGELLGFNFALRGRPRSRRSRPIAKGISNLWSPNLHSEHNQVGFAIHKLATWRNL
jgi:hypothetical protein